MLNRITIMGRLVANPELRYTPKGTPVCSIRIACDREVKNADGEYDTDFIDVVAWRSVAENIARRFAKGRMAVVSGRLQIRNWTDKDGNKRTSAEVVADNVYFGDSNRREDGGAPGRDYGGGNSYGGGNYGGARESSYRDAGYRESGGREQRQPAAPSSFAELDDGDGELPF